MPTISKSSLRIVVVYESMNGSCAYMVCFGAVLIEALTLYWEFKTCVTMSLKSWRRISYSESNDLKR